MQSYPRHFYYYWLILGSCSYVFPLKMELRKRKDNLYMDFAPTNFPVNVLLFLFLLLIHHQYRATYRHKRDFWSKRSINISFQGSFNRIQDGLFSGCLRMEGGGAESPLSLKSVTHILSWRNLAELYLAQGRFRKYINHVTHPLSSPDISIFSPEISKFCYIKKCRYRLDFDT